jgi:hypothetical protein
MSSGLKLWNDQGQLRLDTSDRVLKYLTNTVYSTNTFGVTWVPAGGNAVTQVSTWQIGGLTSVVDTSKNSSTIAYNRFDLDISNYISQASSIVGFISEITIRVASSVYGHPIWKTSYTFQGFTEQVGNTLRIYVGGGPYLETDRGAGTDLLTFKLTLYEY